ncbi:MAG: class I SAM-dependent methyltransferase [Burkholderiaceae bacterium]
MSALINPGASEKAIQFHYDIGNSFYSLWLDSSLTYSCALWDGQDTLEAAQAAKIDYHIDKSGARGHQRVLDIGCGWGATLNRLVTSAGVASATGLTLSSQQAAFIAQKRWPGVDVRMESWSDHMPFAPYDAIISVGAFEHFAKLDQSPAEKIAGYRAFFQKCHDWLPPGGCLSLQTISYENSVREDFSSFFASQIFPESDLPRLSEIACASERLFEIVSLRNDRHQYARTSLEWRRRLLQRRAEAVALVGDEVVARYDRYLHLWAIGFHTGTMGLLRLQLRKLE